MTRQDMIELAQRRANARKMQEYKAAQRKALAEKRECEAAENDIDMPINIRYCELPENDWYI